MIYDTNVLVDMLLHKEIAIEEVVSLANSLFNSWALQPALTISEG